MYYYDDYYYVLLFKSILYLYKELICVPIMRHKARVTFKHTDFIKNDLITKLIVCTTKQIFTLANRDISL